MSQEIFNAILEEKRKEIQSNLVSTEQLLLDESLNKNLKPSPLKSLEQVIKERKSQAHTLVASFLDELRHSIAYLREKSSAEEQKQLCIWVAYLWKQEAKQEHKRENKDIIESTQARESTRESTRQIGSLSEEDIVAALEGDQLWDALETLTIAKPEDPSCKEECFQEKSGILEEAKEKANAIPEIDDAAEMDFPPSPSEVGLQVIYAVIQRCINNCEMEMVSGLYRLSLVFNPLQRDLWMEYAGHTWAFETPEKTESIYHYALELFPGDFYIRICLAEFYHATQRDLEAQKLSHAALDELKKDHREESATYQAFTELENELQVA